MNRTKLGFFVLIFLFGATLLVPVLLTGIASASCGAYARDYDRCAVRDYDRCAVRDYNRTAVRDCDRCDRCSSVSEYRCDLNSCSWTRDYGCCNSR